MMSSSTQQKNVILLHGRWPEKIDGELISDIPLCNPNNRGNWMGWTKEELEKRGYDVSCPIIDNAWKARYDQWKVELDKTSIDKDTILVGLSAGGYALVRYLGETGKKVKKLILIAPGAPEMDREEPLLPYEEEFYSYVITPELKKQIGEIVVFVSNDADSILRAVQTYKKVLGAKEIKLKKMGHFSFLIKKFPELLMEIVK